MKSFDVQGVVEMLEECFSIEETARTFKVHPEVVRTLNEQFAKVIDGTYPIEEVVWESIVVH